MPDRLWCPECERDGYRFEHSDDSPECRYHNCDGQLVEPPLRVKTVWRLKQTLAVAVFGAIFIGPIAWVVLNFGDKPLWATRTIEVTRTVPYGIIPGLVPFVAIWLLMFMMVWAARGGLPRP